MAAKAQLLQDHAEDIIGDPASRAQAARAVAALTRAAQAQAQAQQRLGKSAQQAGPSQQASAAQLNSAAQALGRLGQQLAQAQAKAAAAAKASGEPHPEDKESPLLTEALDQARRAQKQPDPTEAERAAQMLAQLAQKAAEKAQGMGLQPDPQGADSVQLSDPTAGGDGKGTGPQATDETLLRLEEMGISPSDWARLPGRLRNEVLQAANDKSPPQYRALIKQYFQELARQSRTPRADDAPTPPTGPKK